MNLNRASNVESVNITPFEGSLKDEREGRTIVRKDFANQIVKNQTKTDTTEYFATSVLIISPVLLKGSKAEWKGFFMNEDIKFSVADNLFLEQVYNKEVPFTTGTSLNCDLKKIVTCKFDVSGNKVKEAKKIIISNITSWSEGDIVQHRTKRYLKKKVQDAMPSLFTDKDFE